MFFLLSKILYYLVLPFTWIIIAGLIAIFHKRLKIKRISGILCISMLLFFSNDFLINELLLWWEEPAKAIHEIKGPYEVAIILSGVVSPDRKPMDRAYFNKGADRVMHPVQLYKMGLVKKILVSGGSGRLVNNELKEADQIKKVLLYSGIAEEDIIIENQSDNTFQNAKLSCALLSKDFPDKKFLLVTSAFHMRRSKACFQKQGLQFDTFSTDFYTFERKVTPDVFIPNAAALSKWETLTKELTGITMYKFMGYI